MFLGHNSAPMPEVQAESACGPEKQNGALPIRTLTCMRILFAFVVIFKMPLELPNHQLPGSPAGSQVDSLLDAALPPGCVGTQLQCCSERRASTSWGPAHQLPEAQLPHVCCYCRALSQHLGCTARTDALGHQKRLCL